MPNRENEPPLPGRGLTATSAHKLSPVRIAFDLAFVLAIVAGVVVNACSSAGQPGDLGAAPGHAEDGGYLACATPAMGCPCSPNGEVVKCGEVISQIDNFIQCGLGTRTCQGGEWGACEGILATQNIVGNVMIQSGGPSGDAGADSGNGCTACDPYCNSIPSTTIPPEPKFNTDGGLSLMGGAVGGTCTGLTITAATNNILVTAISPIVETPADVQFTAVFTPPGCAPAGTQPTWTVDRVDISAISNTAPTSGQLQVYLAYAGTLNVTAYFAAAAGFLTSNTVPITVTVNALDTVGVSPDVAPSAGAITAFTGAAGATSYSTWLYPYANTYFPLGLLPPVIQYKYTAAPATGAGSAVKVSLRYPVGSTPGMLGTFNYSLIVSEANVVSQSAGLASAPDPQVVLPVLPWQAFQQSARGNNASLVIQRWLGSGTIDLQNPETIHFVNGQLKGTVYYNSYNSTIAGSTPGNLYGGVLAITPEATAPVRAVPALTQCTVCHSVNALGTTLIANSNSCGNGNDDDSCSFNVPADTNIATYWSGSANQDKFTWGGPYPDGTFYLASWDDNYHSYGNNAALFQVPTASTITSTGTPVHGVTPAFSNDGKHVAFTAGTASPGATCGAYSCPNWPSGQGTAGKSLAVMDFNCNAAMGSVTCGGGSPTWAFTNQRTVATTASSAVGYPSFLPDSIGVVYENVVHPAADASLLNTWYGAQDEIWLASATQPFTAERLNALNGLTSGGANYLPTIPRDVSVPTNYNNNFHSATGALGYYETDSCGSGPWTLPEYEDQVNYMPTVNPTAAGGEYWVLFTSRRLYGNIAYSNPFQAERGSCTNIADGPNAGFIETKKLWVSAIDENWSTSGADPSHPAFYLPGQELKAGNSRAYWVNSPCGTVGTTCTTVDDCCQTPSAEACRLNVSNGTASCQLASMCEPTGSTCQTNADCCTPATCFIPPGDGGTPDGGATGVCTAGANYPMSATYTETYTATCAMGTSPVWQLFEYQAVVPANTSVTFSAQSAGTLAALPTATPVAPLGTATTNTPANQWNTSVNGSGSPITVDAALRALNGFSNTYLQINMAFMTNGSATPVLLDWRQIYDCVPSQ